MINIDVSVMRGAAADVMMYRNTPIPMAYTHLLEVFVKIYVLIAPIALVPVLLWVAPIVSMLITFFFYGFLKLGRMMFNPFKDEALVHHVLKYALIYALTTARSVARSNSLLILAVLLAG